MFLIRRRHNWPLDAAKSAFGRLTILVNVAAAVTPDAPVETLPLEEWEQAFSVNLTALIPDGKICYPSHEGCRGWRDCKYCLAAWHNRGPKSVCLLFSKSCVDPFYDHLGAEVAADNIRVNSISPGVINSTHIAPIRSY